MKRNAKGLTPLFILIIIGLIGIVGYFAARNITPTPSPVSKTTPSTTSQNQAPTIDTTNWKIFDNDQYGFEIKIPTDWKEIEHSSNFQNYFPFQAPDGSGLNITVNDNKFSSLEKYLSDYDQKDSTSWEGKPSRKVLDSKTTTAGGYKAIERKETMLAAGFDTIVTYLQVNNKVIIFSIQTGNVPLSQSEAIKSYYLVLSTFKVINNKTSPTAAPTNIKQLSYNLPKGWLTIKDSTNTFEVGYDPATQEAKVDENNTLTITKKNVDNNPYYSPYYASISFIIESYNGGPRHDFIYKKLGENPSKTGSTLKDYKDIDYRISGKSCLVLDGISISQFYTVWGMCVVDNNHALSFTTWNDYETTLKTLRFFR